MENNSNTVLTASYLDSMSTIQ